MSPRAWRAPLRLALRDLRRAPVRAAVLVALVALPVVVATVVSVLVATRDSDSPNAVRTIHGAADAELEVSAWPRVRVLREELFAYGQRARGLAASDRRDPAEVDLAALLPEGSQISPTGRAELDLGTGGSLGVLVADLDDPLTSGLAVVDSGRAPDAGDEVAVSPLVAGALGLLDGDSLVDGAAVRLLDGRALTVTGLLLDTGEWGDLAVVPPAAVTGPDAAVSARDRLPTYLVDLPDLTTTAQLDLARDLAGAGVSGWFRDALVDPAAWGVEPGGSAARRDAVAAAAGALAIGLGLVEVVVLVGAAFAVQARRQHRMLGLLITSGATPADVRRTVLAQGVVIGTTASLVGLGAGAAVLGLGRDPLMRLLGSPLVDYSLPVGGLVTIGVLGAVSAVLAAAVPAWGVARMTAAEALDGRFATGADPGRARVHRFRDLGLLLAGTGLVALVASGAWIARVYASSEHGYVEVSPLPVVAGGLAALVLLVGTGLLVPWLVDRGEPLTRRGRLAWRLATRDATRHRGRTTAAAMAVGMLTTGAVCAGFAVTAQASVPLSGSESTAPAGTVEVMVPTAARRDPDARDALVATAARTTGVDRLVSWDLAVLDGREVSPRRSFGLWVVDDEVLDLVDLEPAARAALADGAVLVTAGRSVREGRVDLVDSYGRGREAVASLPARVVPRLPGYAEAWATAETLAAVGIDVRPAPEGWLVDDEAAAAGVRPPIDATDATTLRLQGITVQGDVLPDDVAGHQLALGALGVLLLTALVVGLVVSLSAAEGSGDAATLAAVGATPATRRATSAAHASYVGGLGAVVGLVVGTALGASLGQVVGTPGTSVPWPGLLVLVVGVPVVCAAVGWAVAPRRVPLTRRTA